ncbi:MAG TPA: SsgA family sporulation/cell division regulator [Nocardioidaceae bacterium]|nr:SsgA family sporulation/cell division regulator [Nocardioidaceae bacterium]
MNTMPRSVNRPVVFEVIGPEQPTLVEAELRYDPADPYAVAVAFLSHGTEVLWVFARDLLIRGVSEPTGDGDVQVFPSLDDDGRAEVGLMLRSPAGQTLMKVPARDVMGFLARSTRSVWPGTESDHLSADKAIAAILVGD